MEELKLQGTSMRSKAVYGIGKKKKKKKKGRLQSVEMLQMRWPSLAQASASASACNHFFFI